MEALSNILKIRILKIQNSTKKAVHYYSFFLFGSISII